MPCHKPVRKWFGNIPPINDFIMRRTWNYLDKEMYSAKEETLPKKMLRAWIPATRKADRLQTSCKDNFIQALKSVLKQEISDVATFMEQFPLAADKTHWS